MCRQWWWVVWLVVISAVVAVKVLGQAPPATEAQMDAVLRYAGIEQLSPADVTRMTELWTTAQQPATPDDRRLALREMFLLYNRLQGRDLSSRPQAMDGLVQYAISVFEGGGTMDLSLPEPRGKPAGHYLHVESMGNGPAHLLLISDLGVDGRKLYGGFAARQKSAYTMDVVTLPYAGRAHPLPWPSRLDNAGRPWLTAIEAELTALLDQPRMKGVTIMGTGAGGYFAARLALSRPKQVHALVLVSALVNVTLRSTPDPDAPASPAQRLAIVKTALPAPQLFPLAPLPPADELQRLVADPKSAHPLARNWMAYAAKDSAVTREWSVDALSHGFFAPSQEFRWELTSTDLTEQLAALSVPTLAMGGWHDEGSPAQSAPNISQWEEVKLRYPAIPLKTAAFADARSYLSVDAPAEFDQALADFLAGRGVRERQTYTLPRTSPRASVTESVGGAEIAIAYGRPAVKGRPVWSKVVPKGRVWRAGANEATTFTLSRDVRVDGHPLSAGTYTFFVIPGDGEWTLVFNRVPRQWGAFDYNPAFDALRITAKPVDVPQQEYLRYDVQPDGASAAIVTLAWEKRAVSFRMEAAIATRHSDAP